MKTTHEERIRVRDHWSREATERIVHATLDLISAHLAAEVNAPPKGKRWEVSVQRRHGLDDQGHRTIFLQGRAILVDVPVLLGVDGREIAGKSADGVVLDEVGTPHEVVTVDPGAKVAH